MSKKKQPRNGFFCFMLEMQSELRAQGREVKMRDMSLLAGPRWARLGDADKMIYNERAKGNKRGPSYAGSNPQPVADYSAPVSRKLDSKGELLSERRDPIAEYEERRRIERGHLKSIFSDGRRVILQKFYFIDVQSLCEISDKDGGQRYLPCEMGVAEFSLSEGITRSIHHFIDPGKIPLGYRFAAQQQSEGTHEIPLEFDMALGDYRYLLGHLEGFLDPEGKGELPPVFAKREHALCVEWTLDWLADKVGVANRVGGVWEVEGLICELKAHGGEKLRHFQAEELLKSSAYDYDTGTRCGWHEERGIKFCALATAKIYCYIVSESLCPLFSVALTSAHLPKVTTSDTVDIVVGRSSRKGRGFGRGGRGPGPWTPARSTTPLSVEQIGSMYIGRGRGRGQRYHHDDEVRKPGGLAEASPQVT